MPSKWTYLTSLSFPFLALAAPLTSTSAPQVRSIESIGYIDPSTDEWSSTLSGVGPLILLIGERSTKQVLRNVRGITSAFSLAAAPLGLLAVVTSLIRFCGIQHLRAFIGYELEARTVAGMEVTRVNCGGVSAALVDGYVVRSMASAPASRLVAVSVLEGGDESGVVGEMAIERIRRSEGFERDKAKLGVPKGVAGLEWVLHVTTSRGGDEVVDAVVQLLAEAVSVDGSAKEVKEIGNQLKNVVEDVKMPVRIDAMEEALTSPSSPDGYRTASVIKRSLSETKEGVHISVLETATELSTPADKIELPVPFWNFTFMSTFDAVSEFTTITSVSQTSTLATGTLSLLSILAVHVLALRHNDWHVSVGWILVMVGYFGIVFGVMLAALLINSSCACIELDTKFSSSEGKGETQWKDGMVVSVKNTDSMDTTGSTLVCSPAAHQTLEAVWIKSISRSDRLIASGVTVTLVFTFIAHYLGLRSIIWWASIGELGICIAAAFVRSASNDLQPRFEEVEDVKLDKRCMSTGVIRTQTSRLVDAPGKGFDARAYSPRSLDDAPTAGERVAFQTAKQCMGDEKVRRVINKLTGMYAHITSSGQKPHHRAVLATFKGGVIFKEGLGFPSVPCMLSFCATLSSLAAPTALLARAIMRQPSWILEVGTLGSDIPLGNVYIFAVQSMLDWWTVSEDRNDMGDLQRNLHWPMFLLNVAFFLEVLRIGEEDEEMVRELEDKHDPAGDGDVRVAGEVVAYLRKLALDNS